MLTIYKNFDPLRQSWKGGHLYLLEIYRCGVEHDRSGERSRE